MCRYIEYCRVTCKPRLSEKAAEMLQNKYVEIRQARAKDFSLSLTVIKTVLLIYFFHCAENETTSS
jgi:DNA replicative helicase MCM subunit Mcm2 (Cdc46/Mcm family)